ncbi:MAG: polysaccharide biosynthesis protein [Thermoguttaceae bacterium]
MTQPTSDGRGGLDREIGPSPVGPTADSQIAPPSPCGWGLRLGQALHRAVVWLGAARVYLLALGHAILFLFAYWLAFGLRLDFEFQTYPHVMARFWASVLWIVGLKVVVFYAAGQYHGWWRYVTFADLVALVRASLLGLILIATADYFLVEQERIAWFVEHERIPRAVLVLDCLLTIAILGALRSSWRILREHFWPAFNPRGFRWALLVGTDHATGVLAHQIQSNAQLQYRIRGLVAANGEKVRRLGQIPVLGPLEDIRQIAASCGATDVLVTAGTLPGARLRSLMETCNQAGLQLRIIPALEDRLHGDSRIPVREIEINDLLRREPVRLDTEAIGRLLEGRTVMVTGAGGSIGSEICRQVLRFRPRVLVLVGHGENRIFQIEQELRQRSFGAVLEPCIGDITDARRMRRLFERYRPEVIFHAAAHKHVPLMESNVGEAIKNNVFGTRCVADLADQFGAHSFVLISTDKAVHPSSIMGVSKQIAERYVHTLSQESRTRFTVVRFGNVLGSACSVVPVFQEQIRRGGPITITDPQMKRYFMTIPEASQLVLQAATMGRGGEIFVLEMGEPISILDLARDLIRLSGLPENAIDIQFIGIRPGEKLSEELYFDDEETLPTSHPKVRAAYHRPYNLAEVRQMISQLERLVDNAPDDLLRRRLQALVPEFKPASPRAGPAEQPAGQHASAVGAGSGAVPP